VRIRIEVAVQSDDLQRAIYCLECRLRSSLLLEDAGQAAEADRDIRMILTESFFLERYRLRAEILGALQLSVRQQDCGEVV